MTDDSGQVMHHQAPGGDRSVAQLDMLHSLGARLNALTDVGAITAAITDELHTIIDYHNCRVYVVLDDGQTLMPIAFHGELSTEYASETYEELVTKIGEGITGWVAEQRTSLLTPDAREVPFSVTIPGTEDDLLESMLAVPMLTADDVVGVIVLSSLGYAMFDDQDQRMLEVLASHAGVAVRNAQLLQAERVTAATSRALLAMSQVLTSRRTVGDILQEAIETLPSVVPCVVVAAYVRDDETRSYRVARLHATGEVAVHTRADIADVPFERAADHLFGDLEPLVIAGEVVRRMLPELVLIDEPGDVLAAPLEWEPDGFGGFVMIRTPGSAPYTEGDLRIVRGVADITSLALRNASRLSALERFHELVEGLDAVFWEADAPAMRLTFVAGRTEGILGPDAASWPDAGMRWGDHVLEPDKALALAAVDEALEASRDVTVEYRVAGPGGDVVWVRDLLHVVRGGPMVRQLRGLMVDISGSKEAEAALRASEQKFSDAFRREREASQQLRALDEMKNTFLEAVSHDLRTPLTAILGSALTLEQAGMDLPPEDADDLIRRIASNARKLERLLGDLLDLDRLQRGIVAPNRRLTDLADLVHRAVAETENQRGRTIEVEAEAVEVDIDAAKVERIVENLVSNALRHTPDRALIWVRARALDGGVQLQVDDDGAGIPKGLRDEVFQPFRQVPGSAAEHSPGVGIGLSLVRRFAELHGGHAWVEERDGGGASFRVFLPTT